MYSTRLLTILLITTFASTFYYHTLAFLVHEDPDASNAVNTFGLLGTDSRFQTSIENFFYDSVPFGALFTCWISDIIGRKLVLASIVLWNIVFVVFALITLSPISLYLVHFVMGLTFACGLVQVYLLLCESVSGEFKRRTTGAIFGVWGAGLAIEAILNYFVVPWKIIDLGVLACWIWVHRNLDFFYESPEYLTSIEDFESAAAVLLKINTDSKEPVKAKDLIEVVKGFKNFSEYLKDFGSNKGFLLILWLNSALAYICLWVSGVKLAEDFYVNQMLAGIVLTSVAGLSYFDQKVDFWKSFLYSVLASRTGIFLLYFINDGGFLCKVLFIISSVGVIYEVYCIFYVTEEITKPRIRGKMFGVLSFVALVMVYLVREFLFELPPSTSQCLLVSLITLSSLVPLYYLKIGCETLEKQRLIPENSINFELKPI